MASFQDLGSVDPSKGNVFGKVRKRIEEKFDSVMQEVAERRDALLQQLDQWQEEYENLKSLQELPGLTFRCETNDVEWRISQLGQLRMFSESEKIETPPASPTKKPQRLFRKFSFSRGDVHAPKDVLPNVTPKLSPSKKIQTPAARDYIQIKRPRLFGKTGALEGQFNNPRGVLVDDTPRRMFIADMQNGRVQVWTMDGEYTSEFGKGTFVQPWEVVLRYAFLFVSDFEGNFLTKWRCTDGFTLAAKSRTTRGSAPSKLFRPSGIDICGREVLVVESGNHRISVFDLDLNFKRVMANKMIKQAYCLRVRNNTIYIMETTGTVNIFSIADELLRKIENGYSFACSIYHFNFDPQLNILFTDRNSNTLSIVSPEGEPIHSIYLKAWLLEQPCGIAVTKEGTIVMSSQALNCSSLALF